MRGVNIHGPAILPLLDGGEEIEVMRLCFLERAGRGTAIETRIRSVLDETLPLSFDAILQRLSEEGHDISRAMLAHHLRIMVILGHIGATPLGCIKLDCEENHPVRRGE